MKLVFASNNAHKLQEVRQILPADCTILSLSDIGFDTEIDETGETLEENSRLKADAVWQYLVEHDLCGEIDGVFSDDTGLEIAALGGAPGVRTARWAGEAHNDCANRQKALALLQGISQREAQFRTVVTLIRNGQAQQIDGIVRGRIAEQEYGNGGFGYDPLFIPEGYDSTFAELPAQVKNDISHRARAMQQLKRFLTLLILVCLTTLAHAGWKSYLSYNQVSLIAVSNDKAYALSNGSLFSVNRITEQIETYGPHTGLHGSNLTMLSYDSRNDQLLLFYGNGKMDIMDSHGVEYINGLYIKDITSDKGVNNVTYRGDTAFLSTDFGVLTFNLRTRTIHDTYYIGVNGTDTRVQDVRIARDSIYAFVQDSVLKASLRDNLVDFRVWQRVSKQQCDIQRDENKGRIVTDNMGDVWSAGGDQGLIRNMKAGNTQYYKPKGPLHNNPYRLYSAGGKTYVLEGGYWAVQNSTPGNVTYYDGRDWHNISYQTIRDATGGVMPLDFSSMVADPNDPDHYFIASYGQGLYEFRNEQVIARYHRDNSTITPAVAQYPEQYTRCAAPVYDHEGNLLVLNAHANAVYTLPILTHEGQWEGLNFMINNRAMKYESPRNLFVDQRHPNWIWSTQCREVTGLMLLDDHGTLLDESDDEAYFRQQWEDQDGHEIRPASIYYAMQAQNGNIWLGTELGPVMIPHYVDFTTSGECYRLRIIDGDEYLLDNQKINDICEDNQQQIWIASATSGVYVLNADGTELLAHYTTENSSMPSNTVLSLAWNDAHATMFVGTSEGLVSYDNKTSGNDAQGGNENDNYNDNQNVGSMLQWHLHPAFANTQRVIVGKKHVYGLSSNSIFSIDKQTEEITTYTKINGLNGSDITSIAYNEATDQLLVVYNSGIIDIVSEQGIYCMLDLYNKAANMSVTVNDVCMRGNMAYLGMPFGIVAVNMRRHEVESTYYIGENAQDVNVQYLAIVNDSLYAAGEDQKLYSASLNDNIVDYAFWHSYPTGKIDKMIAHDNCIYILNDKHIKRRNGSQWETIISHLEVNWLRDAAGRMLAHMPNHGYMQVHANGKYESINVGQNILDIDYDVTTATYWLANKYDGIIRMSDRQSFLPMGPLSNNAYSMRFIGDRLYVSAGGRWAVQYKRDCDISMYQNGMWSGITNSAIRQQTGYPWMDMVDVAGDDDNPDHFFAASYGYGLLEFDNGKVVKHYYEGDKNGSTLLSALQDWIMAYVRVDALYKDSAGYLWMINADTRPYTINVLSPSHKWAAYQIYAGGRRIPIETPGKIVADRRDARYKWMYSQRGETAIILHYDNGTPMFGGDDRAARHTVLYDQDNNQVSLDAIYTLVQDHNNDVWVGTSAGIVVIPASVDLFQKNTCTRIKIARNDGTNLADYLLGTEQINCIAVDGGNRKWIGTASSGLYLVSDDGLTTIHHFTAENSPLPSNSVLSLAIHPRTGEVFIGTSLGIASYQSDASEPQDDYNNAYAYPNPVRGNYTGVITITGLMDNSFVTIVDAAGNLICKTRSQGGTAIWDGKTGDGRRATAGIYTVLCNDSQGKNHAVTKILLFTD